MEENKNDRAGALTPSADAVYGGSDIFPCASASPPPAGGQEIDWVALARRLGKERRFLLKTVLASVVLALIVAFSLPKEYTTTVKLAPEAESVSRSMQSLGGLAAIAGIDMNASHTSDALSPGLYPDVVKSTPFLLNLFPVAVGEGNQKDSLSLYDYMRSHQQKAWWGYVIEAPLKGLAWLIALFSDTPEPAGAVDPFRLTREQEEVVKSLQNRISISVDKKTYIITLSVKMQNAFVSAGLTAVILAKLQDYITSYRTQKEKNNLAFSRKVCREARDAYYKAQQAYAAFEDANRNIASSSYRTEQERLRNEMTLTFNIYNTLAQKLEQDKLRVQEQTPVYTVIEPATVPLHPSSPRKLVILLGFVCLGLLGSIGYLFVRDLFL